MYVMLLLGSIVSALIFGAALADFTPGRLIQVIQASAVATLVLNGIAVWKQEARGRSPARRGGQPDPSFREFLELFHRRWTGHPAADGRWPRHARLQHAGCDA